MFAINIFDLDDGVYYASVGLGDNAQQFNVTLDTGSCYFWVPSTGCTPPLTPAFSCSNNPGTCSTEQQPANSNYDSGSASGILVSTQLTFGNPSIEYASQNISGFTAIAASQIDGFEMGVMGLCPSAVGEMPSVPEALYQEGLIAQPIFSLYLGYDPQQTGYFDLESFVSGEFIVGGMNAAMIRSSIPVTAACEQANLDVTWWLTNITGFNMIYSDGSAVSVTTVATSAMFDTGTSFLLLDDSSYTSFYNNIVSYGAICQEQALTCNCDSLTNLPIIQLQLPNANGTLNISSNALFRATDTENVCESMVASNGGGAGSTIILGDPLLKQYYTVYNFETYQVSFYPQIVAPRIQNFTEADSYAEYTVMQLAPETGDGSGDCYIQNSQLISLLGTDQILDPQSAYVTQVPYFDIPFQDWTPPEDASPPLPFCNANMYSFQIQGGILGLCVGTCDTWYQFTLWNANSTFNTINTGFVSAGYYAVGSFIYLFIQPENLTVYSVFMFDNGEASGPCMQVFTTQLNQISALDPQIPVYNTEPTDASDIDPINTTDPTDPTDSDPTTPTNSTNSTDPTDPTNSTDPTDSDPTNPTNSTNSTDPTDTDPTNSTDPTNDDTTDPVDSISCSIGSYWNGSECLNCSSYCQDQCNSTNQTSNCFYPISNSTAPPSILTLPDNQQTQSINVSLSLSVTQDLTPAQLASVGSGVCSALGAGSDCVMDPPGVQIAPVTTSARRASKRFPTSKRRLQSENQYMITFIILLPTNSGLVSNILTNSSLNLTESGTGEFLTLLQNKINQTLTDPSFQPLSEPLTFTVSSLMCTFVITEQNSDPWKLFGIFTKEMLYAIGGVWILFAVLAEIIICKQKRKRWWDFCFGISGPIFFIVILFHRIYVAIRRKCYPYQVSGQTHEYNSIG